MLDRWAHHGASMRHTSRFRGGWRYLYREVDKQGLTVDFQLREHRDTAAAKRFFTRAIERHAAPKRITPDGYPATHTAIVELRKERVPHPEAKVWTSKYLNNIIEQDHRRVKQRIYQVLGFKEIAHAATTISGIELAQKIRKGQFNVAQLTSGVEVRVPRMWKAVLAG